ncbi:sensor histidine kinase [Zobellia nedashkovskayae]|uniref:sensor histidine kinase n=1 Tax=Zobellia nedashkovskayae TaxID=2779510 RepID=UPI00188D397E|nr:ATP-binding protein [Zobellia nedashkovskayae]
MNDNAPCFLFSFVADHHIDYVNDLMMEALGYEDHEILNTLRFEDLLSGGSRILYKTHFYPMLIIQKDIEEIFISLRSKTGEEIPVLINMSFIKKNGVDYVTGAGLKMSKRNDFEKRILDARRDAEKALQENELLIKTKAQLETSRTLLEDQLQNQSRINKEQIEFNKILAHDLQEPLRKISIFASRLEDFSDLKSQEEKSRHYLKRVLQISENSHALVKRLQVYHALDYKKLHYLTASFETILKDAIIKTGNLPLEIIYGEMEMNEVYGDIPKLTILFSELLKNSYQYRSSEKPTSIHISTSKVTENYHQALKGAYRYIEYICITFRDNSLGFQSYSGDDVFRPLQNSDNSYGKGLGLAFCKKIVELHKGRISIKPEKNGGSKFSILLPIEVPIN